MIRVVIIDDEPLLVRSLQTMIERCGCGMTVVGSANDGVTGLSLIGQTCPDLVFADVSMPVLDGLSLIGRLREEGNEVPVVILSGYQEFSYAQKAVSLGVIEYLVKPVNPMQLKTLLQKISGEIGHQRQRTLSRVLQHAIHGEADADLNAPWVQELRFDCWKVCFGVFQYYRKLGVDETGEAVRQRFGRLLTELCGRQDAWCFDTRYPNEFRLVLLSGPESQAAARAIYEGCLGAEPKKTVTFALGGTGCTLAQLREADARASRLLQTQAAFASSQLLTRQQDPAPVDFSRELDSLRPLLQKQESGQARALLNGLWAECEAKQLTQKQLSGVIKAVLRQSPKAELGEEADYYVSLLTENAEDYAALTSQADALLLEGGTDQAFRLNDKSSRAIIGSVAEYLQAHAAEHISLQSVAEEFGFNYTYLSYLFKKNMGRSPSEYLTACRIERAKELLRRNREYSVKEVAALAGYDDPYYFSRIFKNNTGLSPSEYRRAEPTNQPRQEK
ncbi:MAG TPA: response regulator [Candidatus Fournierella merdigallinarum]|nr:response regulator [Candidatus Fournierella merdigallinarum]